MRHVNRFLILTLLLFAATARGEDVDFEIIFDAFDLPTPPGSPTDFRQVAVTADKKVATKVTVNDVDYLLYSQPDGLGGFTTDIVAKAGDPFFDDPSGAFEFIRNVSITGGPSGPRISFIGESSADGSGVYQFDVNTSTGYRILHNGVTFEGGAFNFEAGALNANASGKVVFLGNSIGTNYIVQGDGANTPVGIVSDTGYGSLTPGSVGNFSVSSISPAMPTITSTDTVVFAGDLVLGDSSIDHNILERPGGNRFVEGGGYVGEMAIASTPTASLFRAHAGGTDHALFVERNGVEQLLSTYDDTDVAVRPNGEMSLSGRVAYFVPTPGNGADVMYQFPDQGTSPIEIGSIGDSLSGDPSLVLQHIPTSSAPMINDNGWVAFHAFISEPGDPEAEWRYAVLGWNILTQDLRVIFQSGDRIFVDGAWRDILPYPFFDESDFLDANSNIFKDNLSEDNLLALGIFYSPDGEADDGRALALLDLDDIVPGVPEPAALCLLPLISLMLIRKRQRSRGGLPGPLPEGE